MKKVSSLLCVFALMLVGVCNGETKTEHWPNGKKKSETNFKDGKKHGLETKWYAYSNSNWQKMWEIHYKDGKKHGLETQWDKDGNIWRQIRWENGNKYELIK